MSRCTCFQGKGEQLPLYRQLIGVKSRSAENAAAAEEWPDVHTSPTNCQFLFVYNCSTRFKFCQRMAVKNNEKLSK